MTVLHRARCPAGVRQTDSSPRPADGGSMMPLAAALRTLGADLVRCDAEGMAGDDHPLDGQAHSGVRAEAGRGVPQREDGEVRRRHAALTRVGLL